MDRHRSRTGIGAAAIVGGACNGNRVDMRAGGSGYGGRYVVEVIEGIVVGDKIAAGIDDTFARPGNRAAGLRGDGKIQGGAEAGRIGSDSDVGRRLGIRNITLFRTTAGAAVGVGDRYGDSIGTKIITARHRNRLAGGRTRYRAVAADPPTVGAHAAGSGVHVAGGVTAD